MDDGLGFDAGGDREPRAWPEAKVVATLVGNAKAATIYYYTKGQTMLNGVKAPAKRVGFFWHRTADTTPDGRKLFIAAVMWALQP
jgi:hypothetical protein